MHKEIFMESNLKTILQMLKNYELLLDGLSLGCGLKYNPSECLKASKEVSLQIAVLQEKLK
jgi:hypothetical protein